eukprot:Em0013g943a
MEERILELESAVERIDALEERLEQISLNQKEDLPVATVPAPLPLPETSSSLGSVELDEVHELERERTVYQKKRLMSIEKARACRGVGETSHDIADHSPEHSSSNSDAD